MIRRRSLDSAVLSSSLEVGTPGKSHGSRKGSLLIIRPSRANQSLAEAQQQIQELGRSLNTPSLSLRLKTHVDEGTVNLTQLFLQKRKSQPIEEESPDQPDGLINTTSFVKQNKSFHKLFVELSEGEALTHTFTCALQKEGLYHGKLYLSVNFLCFHSSVLLKDTKVVIPVANVSEVKKHKLNLTMLSVRMDTGDKYSFGSLRNREACYKLLQSICSQTQQGAESANSSPRVSSGENEVDQDIMSSPSSLDGSVPSVSRNNSLCVESVDNDFLGLTNAGPARRRSSVSVSSAVQTQTLEEMTSTPEERGDLWTLDGIFERVPSLPLPSLPLPSLSFPSLPFRKPETGHLNVVFYVYLLLLVVLLFTSGYIGLRIVALEEQLNALGALAEFSLHHSEYKET